MLLYPALTAEAVLEPCFSGSWEDAGSQTAEKQYCAFPGGRCGTVERLAKSCEARGVQEHLFVQTGNARKCGFIAMNGRDSAHITLGVLVMCKNLRYLEFCSSKTEILETQTICRWCLT